MTDTTQQPDTPALIAELWDASDGGTAEWWAGEIRLIGNGCDGLTVVRTLVISLGTQHWISDPDDPWWTHALDIIVGHAERWLRGRGWGWVLCPDFDGDDRVLYYHDADTIPYKPLADALRAEMERGG